MKYENKYGFIGWREFLTNRKELLDEYDKALEKNSNRPVRISHGIAGEAAFRKMLKNHLPKRYGVTSGYIIPDIVSGDYKLYHYDVIIYDRLNSPVLWSEEDFDTSALGKKRAIPAKYVLSVIEIKSTFNQKNVKDSIAKLSELSPLKNHLHPFFSSNAVFFELKNNEINNIDILKQFCFKNEINFWGGLILRSELNTEMTGIISYGIDEDNNKNTEQSSVLVRDVNETKLVRKINGNIQLSNGGCELYIDQQGVNHFGKMYQSRIQEKNLIVNIGWSYSSFATYIIKILHLLENINTNKVHKYFFGRVYDIPENEL
ncbi:MAG: hypothetical protein Q8K02_08970 [Flavobacterium sp.]|nr:hypothetical protein [Flavobacterium sp.]